MKTIHIHTFGCQMNDYESDRTFRTFRDQHDYSWEEDPRRADVVIFNTCSIREKADQKAFSSIGALRSVKTERPEMVIAVGGCMAQMQGEDLQKRFPFVDVVFGTHQWCELPDLIKRAQEEREKILDIEFYGWRNFRFLPYRAGSSSHPVSEFVTVQNGCDRFCTFCLVPFTRGREVSRPVGEILDEVRSLVGQGVREVTLLGQNVNAYGRDRSGEISFAQLLSRVGQVDGLDRIRFMTSHPAELTRDMIHAMADQEKVCAHLHLPLQSGSDRILSRMNRGYTVKEFRDKLSYLAKTVPNITVTTDLIVGFPSETDEDFQGTLSALREFDFDDSYSFCYSPRPRTKAAEWTEEAISPEVSAERLARLQSLQDDILIRRNSAWIGKVVEILVEGKAKSGLGLLAGKLRTHHTAHFPGMEDEIGKRATIRITDAMAHTLRGERVEGAPC